MLTKLICRNFKRFGEIKVELGNPVVFIGPNNSGKTTALQALSLWEIGLERLNFWIHCSLHSLKSLNYPILCKKRIIIRWSNIYQQNRLTPKLRMCLTVYWKLQVMRNL